MPGFVHKLPVPVRQWLEGAISDTPQQVAPAPGPSPLATPAPTPKPSASPEASPTPEPSPTQPSQVASPTPSASEPTTPTATVPVSKLAPNIQTSANPLQASATFLYSRGSKLYIGLSDGGIAIRDTGAKGTGGISVRLPQSAGPVRAITAGDDGTVWWLAATKNQLYAYNEKSKSLRLFEPSATTFPGVADALTVIPAHNKSGIVAVVAGSALLMVDGDTGAVRDPADVLPPAAVSAIARYSTLLRLAIDPNRSDHASLMVLSGDGAEAGTAAAISLWTTNDIRTPDDWVPQTVAPASIPSFSGLRIGESGEPGVALGAKNFALLSKPAGGQTLAACRISVGSLSDASPLVLHSTGTLPEGVFGLWQQPDRIALGDSGIWWTFSGIVFHSTPSGDTEAYMPWNGAGDEKHGHIACLLADDKGVWVAADTGIHRITPDHPTDADGFGGYMRIALGPNTAQPPANSVCQKLNQLTQQWQGVPYKWGGDSKAGIDCSGYVCKLFEGVGITVPRATTELGNGSEGKRIRDDLKYGDVLVFPGHCAMYIGNGWTTEALDQGVGKAAIWSRKNVVIKRFLKS